MAAVDTTPSVIALSRKGESFWKTARRRLLRHRAAMLGLAVILIFVVMAITAPWIAPYDPAKMSMRAALQSPSAAHLLGTDKLGRDVFSRIVYGSRYSLSSAALTVAWALLIGGAFGAIAGAGGRIVDSIVMRITDVLMAFPSILLAIGVVSWLGKGDFQLTIAVGLSLAPTFTRLLRASLLSLQAADFVTALRAAGIPKWRILFIHTLPNALTPMIVQATLALGTTIITVAGLGFLGLGPQDPRIPEWGGMMIEGAALLQFPHLVLGPGICIVAVVLGVNLFGDGLRDALDPKAKR